MQLCSNASLLCFRDKFAAVDKQYTKVPIFDAFSESLYQGKIIERMKWTRGTPLSPMVIRFAPAIWLPKKRTFRAKPVDELRAIAIY